jgi:hypothetical protein
MPSARSSTPQDRAPEFVASLALLSLLLATSGCQAKSAASPENFIAGLNAHFLDHPECLFAEAPRFPYETSDPADTKRMNALVASQLLTVQEELTIHVRRYTPTVAGARAAPRFCYGHRLISSIDSFTPPVQANGFPETQVAYHYTMVDLPVWAKSDAMRAAFPAMAQASSGTATDNATLAGTMAGWQVPD